MEETVIIPQLTHSTIQNVLNINQTLLKILVEYQNHGWLDEPEFKIYQQRLSKNLLFLSSLAQNVQQKADSKPNSIPDLSPVQIPDKVKSCFDDKNDKLESIKPPSMVHDPNPNVAKCQPYEPVQPFVMPSNVELPGNTTSVPYVKEEIAENALKQRYLNETRLKRTAAFEEEENEAVQLASGRSTPKESFSKENLVTSPGDLDEEDEDYVPENENELDGPLLNSNVSLTGGFFDEM